MFRRVMLFFLHRNDWRIAVTATVAATAIMTIQQSRGIISVDFLKFLFLLAISAAAAAILYILRNEAWLLRDVPYDTFDWDWLEQAWLGEKFSRQIEDFMWKQCGGRCVTCGHNIIRGLPNSIKEAVKKFLMGYRIGHLSHKWPRSKGGAGNIKNCRGFECHVCNIRRGNRTDDIAIQTVIEHGQDVLVKPIKGN